MLFDSEPGAITGKMEQCKRDYEKEIERARNEVNRHVKLKDALMDFVGNRHQPDVVATFVGELVLNIQRINIQIEGLIEAQEKEKEKL